MATVRMSYHFSKACQRWYGFVYSDRVALWLFCLSET